MHVASTENAPSVDDEFKSSDHTIGNTTIKTQLL